MEATPEERTHFEITPSGYGIHWPEIDEDLSGSGLLRGAPSPRPGSRRNEPAPGRAAWSPGAVRQLRRRLGLSQTAFAGQMGVRQAAVSNWENGRQGPSPMACRFLDLLARLPQHV